MAEILFMAVDKKHQDVFREARECYKRGDPVVVKPDGWQWGNLEVLPPNQGGHFFRVRIVGVTPEQLEDLVRSRLGLDLTGGELETPGDAASVVPITRRALSLKVDLLPSAVQRTLWQTGEYTTTLSDIRQFVMRKRTAGVL